MTKEARNQTIAELFKDHEKFFKTNKIENPYFNPKLAYRPRGKDELYIQLFPSELKKNQDHYIEFVDVDYNPKDSKRTLYIYKHNPFWREEYEMTKDKNGYERVLVPVSELKPISDITFNDRVLDNFINFGEEDELTELLRGINILISNYLKNK